MADFDPVAMDNAAASADADLSNLNEEAVKEVAKWWLKWYLKTPDGKVGAGHKRLGRIMVAIANENKEEEE